MSKSSYTHPVDQLLSLGEPDLRHWADYAALGIGREHSAELMRMIQDSELNEAWNNTTEVWAPLHAWRALGQFRVEDAVPVLVWWIEEMGPGDEWSFEELPLVLGMIGSAAVAPLKSLLADASRAERARQTAGRAPVHVAERHPAERDRCVAALARQLERNDRSDEESNAFLVCNLVDLEAYEALPAIRSAYIAKKVHCSVITWPDVREAFGLEPAAGDPPDEYRAMWNFGPPTIDKQPRIDLGPGHDKAKAKRKLARKTRTRNRVHR
ncbi:MAG: DUF1186 domain-containing protein [Planctomycetes bacterium]|nr:DUF1186 domain-containing protein [Planctomycetota bacterium]MBI3843672.1 DUF1186 domain-containing protein [Planctomycetota bacterium]